MPPIWTDARVTYLDANATQPLRPEARAAMVESLGVTGNPSSVHAGGRAARRILEDSRERLAAWLGGGEAVAVFTSGATEANAAALHALAPGRRVIVAATEHDAVLRNAPGADVLPVDRNGLPRLDLLESWLLGPPALVCLMLANNETGVIHPVRETAALCHAAGALLHVDAVQAAGRIDVDMGLTQADSLVVSSHKLGGPAGAGLWLLADARAPRPLVAGGGQEGGWRGGTPSVTAIAGFAAAACAERLDTAPIRDAIEAAALGCGALVVGGGATRLPNTTCLVLPGVAAQTQVMALDLAGIAVSAGAACSSGVVARSHVLAAMGLGEAAGQAIRVSVPWDATMDAAHAFAAAYRAMARRLARRAA